MTGQNRLTKHDALCLGALLLVAALFFWPAWLQPDSFWYPPGSEFSDITYTHWPKMQYVQQTWREHGQIPLWMTLVIGGTPFVGNPLAAYFYPLNWLFLFLPVTFTFHLIFALQVFLAGAMAYGLLRWSYRQTPFAALVGGLCYMLSPKLMAHVGTGHVGWSQAYTWLPLTLWLLRHALERDALGRPGARRAAWCGASIALTYFADPRVMFYSVLLHAGYALYRLAGLWRIQGFKSMLGVALRLTALPLAFVLIGAAQMLPTAELMSMSTRAELTLDQAGVYSLPWHYLIGFLLSDRGGFHEWMTYLGLLPLGLALLALLRRKTEDRWFWLGAAIAILFYGSGVNGPLYPLLFRLLPGLGWVRVPSRVLMLLPLVGSALAGLGVDALLSPWSEWARCRATLIALGGALICLGAGVGLALIVGPSLPTSVWVFATVGMATMALLLLAAHGLLPQWALKTTVVALILVDLWSMGRSAMELRSFDEIMGERANVAAYLAAQESRFRVCSPSYSIPHHVGARYEIEQLDGIEPSHTWWLADFMALAGGYELDGYAVTIPAFPTESDVRTVMRDAVPSAALLGLMNGRYIAADFPIDAPGWTLETQFAPVYLYRNEQAMPRAFTVARAETVPSWPEAQARLAAGFDPTQAALVESDRPLDGRPGYREAEIATFLPNRIVVEAQVDVPSLLVLAEVWYPGWQARIDGVRQPIYRTYGLMRGIYLDQGAHRVELIYSPTSLWIGLAVSVVSILGLIAASAIKRTNPPGG
ncbi:MAG: hypothetical protein JW934_17320 [Anaerolineae bacterium]|nr:hypothetical protein [Anaerolineae bacterium]